MESKRKCTVLSYFKKKLKPTNNNEETSVNTQMNIESVSMNITLPLGNITAESENEASKNEVFLPNTESTDCWDDKQVKTAYTIAKNQRPYTDMQNLVDLQIINGLDIGRILQTNKACSNIIDHITFEMRKKLCLDLLHNKRKICIIVDESTTLSQKSMLVICLRSAVSNNNDVITNFFNIIEVQNTSANSIKTAILTDLYAHGLTDDFLKENLIAFVSDGASNMLGRLSCVGVQLQSIYPNILIWHCCNHQLELAVFDTLKKVQGTNHFQSFIEKIYALYHQSPKNMHGLSECAASLETKLLHIGKIFTIRCVASSEKTLKAVWNNYVSLSDHFSKAAIDIK
ncbi:E3 SUMO-protein ligase KIAA1586-like isoform X4 [Aphis craccivora]|uniref:E3 SUMO-protein ligase KIAA1586-like isoform X4 n=1 Tax=Aphis craccivora TaxID=307492 RepID=A0A6G0Y8S2_APHCR|nr:E3 SUMO-protein ligase KIAA1586-like isoform X4 [Aphis craccivora]